MIRYNNDHVEMAQRQADIIPIKELLFKQSRGKVQLTREEKLRVQKYAEQTRRERN